MGSDGDEFAFCLFHGKFASNILERQNASQIDILALVYTSGYEVHHVLFIVPPQKFQIVFSEYRALEIALNGAVLFYGNLLLIAREKFDYSLNGLPEYLLH